MYKLKNYEPRPKFAGSYKKKRVYLLATFQPHVPMKQVLIKGVYLLYEIETSTTLCNFTRSLTAYVQRQPTQSVRGSKVPRA